MYFDIAHTAMLDAAYAVTFLPSCNVLTAMQHFWFLQSSCMRYACFGILGAISNQTFWCAQQARCCFAGVRSAKKVLTSALLARTRNSTLQETSSTTTPTNVTLPPKHAEQRQQAQVCKQRTLIATYLSMIFSCRLDARDCSVCNQCMLGNC